MKTMAMPNENDGALPPVEERQGGSEEVPHPRYRELSATANREFTNYAGLVTGDVPGTASASASDPTQCAANASGASAVRSPSPSGEAVSSGSLTPRKRESVDLDPEGGGAAPPKPRCPNRTAIAEEDECV